MPVEVILPKVDMDMATGSIATWHVDEGETITKGEPLFDIETDKAAMEVEAPATGTLHHITVDVGSEVPIGTILAWIYAEGEEVAEPPQTSGQVQPDQEPEAPPAAPTPPETKPDAEIVASQTIHGDEKIRATPAARRLAADNGVSLETAVGTGPRGRVQRNDIESLLNAPAPAAQSAPQGWSVQSGDLAITSSGSGSGTPWVLIHGFAADASGWTLLEKQLSRQAPVHRIELPNHGRSPRRNVANFADLVSQVRQAFDNLADQKLNLVGHSLGAAVCLALADTRPRKIDALTLISPAGLGPHINGAVLSGVAKANQPTSLAPWLKQLSADPDLISDNYTRAAFHQRRDSELRAAQLNMMGKLFPDGVQAFDVRAALKRLNCPTRIIWGKQDKIIPWDHVQGVPGEVSLNLFEGIGHLPHVEIPDQVLALITR